MEIESCSLLLQALPLGGCGQGELVGVEKWQDPLLQAQLEVPQPKGCPEGGSGDPKPSGVGRGTLGWHPPPPCCMQQQAGGGLVGPWVEAEVCSEPLRGLSLTNLLRETYSSITLLGGHQPPMGHQPPGGGPAVCWGAGLQKESGGTDRRS